MDNKRKDFTPDVVLFTFQIALIFVVACVSLLNLTNQWGNQNLWTVILTGSLGYIMPNPKLKIGNSNDKQLSTDLTSKEIL
jgi:hypothetical protein